MGWNEYRTPGALGGTVPALLYRTDVEWLRKEAVRRSRWLQAMRKNGNRLHYADVVHELVLAAMRQRRMRLRWRKPGH
jgi:hypothetical protein